MENIITRLISLPYAVEGTTVKDENGDYNMYLNANLPMERIQAAYEHEIIHIEYGHFYDERPVEVKEAEVQYILDLRKKKQ